MPEYRATRFINTREADTYDFTAENDEAARETLLLSHNLDWSGDADLVDCDVPDEVLALDRRKDDGSYETVDDEIELPGQRPYGQPSRQFVLNVAALGEEGAYDDATESLQKLIEEARALCNVSEPTASKPASPPKRDAVPQVNTPTPYSLKLSDFDNEILILSDETCVASVPIWNNEDKGDGLREQSIANAHFILRACNAYDNLTGTLKLALLALNTAPRFRVGETHSYAIATRIENVLSSAEPGTGYPHYPAHDTSTRH
jgi:hypothetical protein